MADRERKKRTEVKGSAASIFEEIDRHVKDLQLPGSGERASSIEALRRSYSFIETLLHVSSEINSTLNLEDLLKNIVDAVVEITDCTRGYLMLHEDGELKLALARSTKGEAMSAENFDRSLSVIQKAADTGEPQVINNAQEEDDLKNQRSIVDLNIRTVICIPLKFEENLVGVIYADSDHISETFSLSDLSIMNAFGAQAAVAIENARRHGELQLIKKSLESQNVSLRHELAEKYEFSGIIGRSAAMKDIFEIITKVAPLATTVLVQGETGTGKELIAKAIHYNSDRKEQPMVSVNCGALPRDILESELFGYRRGAFTGADQDRQGLFEAADGGTLFLDEIGEMPQELQVKLLRALQEGEIRRLGEDRPRTVNVRIIAATNRDLATEVEKGRFRNDLFYRLNVVPIVVPPLREHPEDVLPLAEFFLEKYSKEMSKLKPVLTRSAKELLLHHTWGGNVRELENSIERALALGEGKKTLDVDQFSHLIKRNTIEEALNGQPALKPMLLGLEKDFIRKMLIKNSWNVTQTARLLKISRQQLHNKIKKFGLTSDARGTTG